MMVILEIGAAILVGWVLLGVAMVGLYNLVKYVVQRA